MKTKIMPKDFKLIRESFDYTTTSFPERIGFLEKRQGVDNFRQIKYSNFRKEVIALGCALIEKLKLKDEKIIVMGENSYKWAVSYYAITCGVGIVVPIDKELPLREVALLAKRSNAKAIIFSSKKRELVNELKKEENNLKYYIELYQDEIKENNPLKTEDDYSLETLIEYGKTLDEGLLMNTVINPYDFKILLFTSGTTAESKGVMLSNNNVMSNARAALEKVCLYETDRFFSVLPLHHSYEATVGMILPIYSGLSIAYAGGLKTIKSDIKETSPSIMLVVPALAESLIKGINANIVKSGKEELVNKIIKLTKPFKDYAVPIKRKLFKEIYSALGGNLRIMVSAAAPIDPDIGKRIEDFGIMFLQGYGLTETSPLATVIPYNDRNPASVGVKASCCDVKINEPNEDGIGEVWINGENVMLGYYENQEATDEVFTDNWFHSGDLGYFDDKGFLYLTGRSKNLIITGNGKNVYPEELERFVNQIKEVKESIVYEKKDPRDENERIIAVKVTLDKQYIEDKYGKDRPNEKEMHNIIWEKIKEMNKTLAQYKYIKDLEIKKEDFAKTTTMKIKRHEEINK